MEYLICAPSPDGRTRALAKLIRGKKEPLQVIRRAPKTPLTAPVCAIFPFRIASETLREFLEGLCPRSVCFGAVLPEELRPLLKEKDLNWIEQTNKPRFQRKNAALTAEGALGVWMRESNRAISESRCALTGYGHVARACAARFSALGAKVVILARRKEARKAAEKKGYTALHLPPKKRELFALKDCDALFNTVCADGILSEKISGALRKKALVFDLASGTQNASSAFIEKHAPLFIRLPALPARACPESAAQLRFSEVQNTLKQLQKGRMPSV